MPGSVITLPGTPNPADPTTGFQFVIEPGESGWYHSDGLPYWLSAFQVGAMRSWCHATQGGPFLRNLMYHFADDWPTYGSAVHPTTEGDPVLGWQTSDMAIKLKELHISSFRSVELRIDINIQETDNPNQHGVINLIRADFPVYGLAGFPIFVYGGPIVTYMSYDIYMGVTDQDLVEYANQPFPGMTDGYLQGYSHAATHEFGHALGLFHTFSGLKLPGFEDNQEFTRMSYTSMTQNPYGDNVFVDFTDMDTAALQFLYGPSKKVRTGDDTYVLNESKPNWLWDSVGIDTIDASELNAPVTISLHPGYWGYIGSARGYGITAPGSVTVNFGSTFENVIGSAFNDTFTGNETDNRIDGRAGIDTVLFTHARSSYNLERLADGNWITRDQHALPATPQPLINIDNSTVNWFGMPPSDGLAAVPFDGNDGIDTLIGVERMRFADHSLALDLAEGQSGNVVARLIGAAFGKSYLANKYLIGAGLSLVDGGLGIEALCQLIVDNQYLGPLAGGIDNDSVLKLVFNNVVGRSATEADLTELLPLVNQQGQAWLLHAAAVLPATDIQIDLVGLQAAGLPFVG